MESPPKRITRSRAAAKSTDAPMKTTKIVTAASKARTASAAMATTKSAAAKRKTRSDEKDDGDGEPGDATTRRSAGARARKTKGTEDSSQAAKKMSVSSRMDDLAAGSHAAEGSCQERSATSRLRGRPRKPQKLDSEGATRELRNRTPQTRSGGLVGACSDTSRPPVRKSVRFRESDKENAIIASKTKDSIKTIQTRGFRGRPARRGAANLSKDTTKEVAHSNEDEYKKPLSPKKVTQMPLCRGQDGLEDELIEDDAKHENGLKSRLISESAVQAASENCKTMDIIEDASRLSATQTTTTIGSPPRRPPSSPLKDSLKSPAKRMGSTQLPGSALKQSTTISVGSTTQTPSVRANTLLQSPAKRPTSPMKSLIFPVSNLERTRHVPPPNFGCSMLQSPAKRALPGFQSATTLGYTSETSTTAFLLVVPDHDSASSTAEDAPLSDRLLDEVADEHTEPIAEDPIYRYPSSSCLARNTPTALERHEDLLSNDSVANDEASWPVLNLNRDPSPCDTAPCNESERAQESMMNSCEQSSTQQLAATGRTQGEYVYLSNSAIGDSEGDRIVVVSTPGLGPSENDSTDSLNFRLRDDVLNPCTGTDSDLEPEDHETPATQYPSTPQRGLRGSARNAKSSMAIAGSPSEKHSIRVNSLTDQLRAWSTTSPAKVVSGSAANSDRHNDNPVPASYSQPQHAAVIDLFPGQHSVFEERDGLLAHGSPVATSDRRSVQTTLEDDNDVTAATMDDDVTTDEGIARVEEADGLSPGREENPFIDLNSQLADDAVTEASQDYGDENQPPKDLSLSSKRLVVPPVTPSRPVRLNFFSTTTKVPLKPAGNSEPGLSSKRCLSESRLSSRKFGHLPNNAEAISASPTKQTPSSAFSGLERFSTPSKGKLGPGVGLAEPTPRRDVDPGLLSGVVVFVDVHTTEGADASGIFVELLGSMGAKCVKTWQCSPSGSNHSEAPSGKAGVTHVVFKDGSKRTIEKVRESDGVVHCVGVSWVLDCERENEWLDEMPYYFHTSMALRGGARRRKSMEPRAIANVDGVMVSNPRRSSEGPRTPRNRRESTLWVRTPPEQVDDHDEDGEECEDPDWAGALLTPVPQTPAADAIARYASALVDTPSSEDASLDMSPIKKPFLLTRTCPPKEGKFREVGDEILDHDEDERVMLRLMAARRKSLQFAPKIASPLSRTWE